MTDEQVPGWEFTVWVDRYADGWRPNAFQTPQDAWNWIRAGNTNGSPFRVTAELYPTQWEFPTNRVENEKWPCERTAGGTE